MLYKIFKYRYLFFTKEPDTLGTRMKVWEFMELFQYIFNYLI